MRTARDTRQLGSSRRGILPSILNEVHSERWFCGDARVAIRGARSRLSRGLSE